MAKRQRVARGVESRQVEHCADVGSSSTDDPAACSLAAVAGDGSQSGESRDPSPVEGPELRQFSQEGCRDDLADARDRSEASIDHGQVWSDADDLWTLSLEKANSIGFRSGL